MCASFLHIVDRYSLFYFIKPSAKWVYKQDLKQSDKVEVDGKWSECVCASTAAAWCLIPK